MKNAIVSLMLALAVAGCSRDRQVNLNDQSSAIAGLQTQQDLNNALDAARDALIALNTQSINDLTTRVVALEGLTSTLQSDLASESAARSAGDAALQAAINSQNSINSSLSGQISSLQGQLTATQLAQALSNIIMSAQIAQNTQKITVIQGQITSLQSQVNANTANISSLQGAVASLQTTVGQLQTRTTNLETGVQNLINRMTSAEGSISSMQAAIALLQANQVTIVDPCPNVANSEVLLRVQGQLVAFYQGTEGFLSVINNGSYRTTDPQQCVFTVTNGQITSSGPAAPTPTPTPTPTPVPTPTPTPALAGNCTVTLNQTYSGQNQYTFAVSGMANYLNYSLDVKFTSGGKISSVGNSNGGTSSYSNPTWTIAPANSSTGFMFYVYHNGTNGSIPTVNTAKVSKNGQEMSCTVVQ